MRPAPLTGSATFFSPKKPTRIIVDATRAPHGDCNRKFIVHVISSAEMRPAPLTGTAPVIIHFFPEVDDLMRSAPLTGSATSSLILSSAKS